MKQLRFVNRVLRQSYNIFENSRQLTHFEFASTLVKHKVLTIKIAFVNEGYGMFHDKTGYFKDRDENTVSFSGSLNESGMALSGDGNFERVKVFKSWETNDADRVEDDVNYIAELIDNKNSKIKVISFPQLPMEKL